MATAVTNKGTTTTTTAKNVTTKKPNKIKKGVAEDGGSIASAASTEDGAVNRNSGDKEVSSAKRSKEAGSSGQAKASMEALTAEEKKALEAVLGKVYAALSNSGKFGAACASAFSYLTGTQKSAESLVVANLEKILDSAEGQIIAKSGKWLYVFLFVLNSEHHSKKVSKLLKEHGERLMAELKKPIDASVATLEAENALDAHIEQLCELHPHLKQEKVKELFQSSQFFEFAKLALKVS